VQKKNVEVEVEVEVDDESEFILDDYESGGSNDDGFSPEVKQLMMK
jgi:hypothetical protein